MRLRKITRVKGVGRFKAGGVTGGEYERFTLFYGGNGRGKTTLCAILRSLQRNDPTFINRRKTFKHVGPQEVQLVLDSGPVSFSNGAWSAAQPNIHIFDQDFIAENVHAGQQIGVEQRRAFYRVAVGPKGVELAAAVDALDAEASTAQSAIGVEARLLQQHVPEGMTLDAFLALPTEEDFDAAVEAARIASKAADNAVAISARSLLNPVDLPQLPAGFEVMMQTGLQDVSADAARRVAGQLAKHDFQHEGEAWLQKGLGHVDNGDCPFCGRALEGVELIKVYEGYFSKAYAAHKLAIESLKTGVKQEIGEAAGLRAAQGFKEAKAHAQFWSEYGVDDYAAPADEDDIVAALRALEKAAGALVEAKAAAPLEDISLSPEFADALVLWEAISNTFAAANAAMTAANVQIQAVKDSNASTNPAAAKGALDILLAAQKRHTDPVLGMAERYAALVATKADLVGQKATKKVDLDAYDTEMLGGYQSAINAILTRFDAGFRLTKCSKNYMGGTPQSAYCLQFGDTDVDVSAKIEDDAPTFATTLSAGDKNTFALAFFLAQLDRDDALAEKLVVFDDPFTSLDDFRKEMTAKAIVRAGERAAQTIVLSHDKYFLDAVRRKIHGHQCAAMQISVTQGDSALAPWDIEWEVKEGYLQDHMELSDFAAGVEGNAKDMRTKMRPLLEKYIRYRFPNKIPDGVWLGEMCGIIRDDADHALQPQLGELDDINEYTAPFHHDPNKPFNADEVLAHVKRTLAIVGGC